MVLLEPDPFLNELNRMYERSKDKGTIFVTMKRSNLKPRKSKNPRTDLPHVCLIRASDGKKHVSTTVAAGQHAKFAASINIIMKAHMDALKRKEKPKKEKAGK